MKVYRIENHTKIGPYRQNHISDYDLLVSTDKRPAPGRDPKLPTNIRYKADSSIYFGFESLKQLKQWFPRATRRELSKKGYKCHVFDTKNYYKGTNQILFYRSNLEPIESIPNLEWVE